MAATKITDSLYFVLEDILKNNGAESKEYITAWSEYETKLAKILENRKNYND